MITYCLFIVYKLFINCRMKLPALDEFDLRQKMVLVRADLDVPLGRIQNSEFRIQNWEVAERKSVNFALRNFTLNVPATLKFSKKIFSVADDTRLRECLPTIEYLLKKNCRVILMGHLGRPEGKVVRELSLWPVAKKLRQFLDEKLKMKNEKRQLEIKNFRGFGILPDLYLIENLRFSPEEENNDSGFAKKLADLGDFYVNECFATSHRRHASFVGIPKFLPHAAGFHLVKEVEVLSKVLENPRRPVVIIIGGAKEEKLKLIPQFLKIADFVLIGGWLLKRTRLRSLSFGGQSGKKIFACLTKDGKDITVKSAEKLGEIISQGGTVVWNGPMGVYEDERDIQGTKIIAEAIVDSKALKIAGGGDTEAVIDKLGLKNKFDWISSGGGAMLEFLAKGTLPGIEALA